MGDKSNQNISDISDTTAKISDTILDKSPLNSVGIKPRALGQGTMYKGGKNTMAIGEHSNVIMGNGAMVNIVDSDDYKSLEYANSELFTARLQTRGKSVAHQRHLDVTFSKRPETLQIKEDIKLEGQPTPHRTQRNSNKKKITPKKVKKKSVEAKGTPELHRFFKKMKERKDAKN